MLVVVLSDLVAFLYECSYVFREYFVVCFHFAVGNVVLVCCEYGVGYDSISSVNVFRELCVFEYVFYFLCELFPVCFPVVCEGA